MRKYIIAQRFMALLHEALGHGVSSGSTLKVSHSGMATVDPADLAVSSDDSLAARGR